MPKAKALTELTKKELKALADELGVTYSSKSNKPALLAAVEGALDANEGAEGDSPLPNEAKDANTMHVEGRAGRLRSQDRRVQLIQKQERTERLAAGLIAVRRAMDDEALEEALVDAFGETDPRAALDKLISTL